MALCPNLQFLNLAYNCISDAEEVNKLRNLSNLQELYLAHNKVNFQFNKDIDKVGGGPSRRNYQTIWPVLEVLDLTANRCTDLTQVSFLFANYFVQTSILRIIGVRGNLPNHNPDSVSEKWPSQINFTLTFTEILSLHSKFTKSGDKHIVRACLGVESIG